MIELEKIYSFRKPSKSLLEHLHQLYDEEFVQKFISHRLGDYRFETKTIVRNNKKRLCFYLKPSKDTIYFDNEEDTWDLELDNLFWYFKINLVPRNQYAISGRSIAKKISRLNKYNDIDNVFLFDVEKFYESIDHSLLLKKIKKLNDNILYAYIEKFLRSYTKSTGYKYGLPLGIRLSQILSEFYLIDIERDLVNFCKDNNFFYIRYVDNFCILHNKKDKSISDSINAKTKTFFRNKFQSDLFLNIIFQEENIICNKEGNLRFSFLGYYYALEKNSTLIKVTDKVIKSIKGRITNHVFICLKRSKSSKELAGVSSFDYLKGINSLIRGYNKRMFTPVFENHVIPHGLGPFFSVVNDFEQIKDMEKWLGSITSFFKHKLSEELKIYDGSAWLELNDKILYSHKLESLRYWCFKYKKNYYNAVILCHKRALLDNNIRQAGAINVNSYFSEKYSIENYFPSFKNLDDIITFYDSGDFTPFFSDENQIEAMENARNEEWIQKQRYGYEEEESDLGPGESIDWSRVEQIHGTSELDELSPGVLDDILSGGLGYGF